MTGFKDIPFKTDPRFKPIYASLVFVDGTTFKTLEMPQQPACKFNHKHVFLVGNINATSLKELLSQDLVRVYLHDCDEYVSANSTVTFPVG